VSEDADYYDLNPEEIRNHVEKWSQEAQQALQGNKRVWDAAALGLPEYQRLAADEAYERVKQRSQFVNLSNHAIPPIDYETFSPEDKAFLAEMKVSV
jgi:hypothetical protein